VTLSAPSLKIGGPTLSNLTTTTGEAKLVLPVTSAASAVKLWLPFGKMPLVKPQAPLPFAVVVPIWFVPSNTVTALWAAACPIGPYRHRSPSRDVLPHMGLSSGHIE
jgi:hypothetical protein